MELIDRQAAIDAVIRHLQLDYEYAWGVREAINALPSAQPTQKKYSNSLDALDCVSRQAAIDAVNEYLRLSEVSKTVQNMTSIQAILKQLPTAEPKAGRWVDDEVTSTSRCSVCGAEFNWFDNDVERFKFCPNCGARMKGGYQ